MIVHLRDTEFVRRAQERRGAARCAECLSIGCHGELPRDPELHRKTLTLPHLSLERGGRQQRDWGFVYQFLTVTATTCCSPTTGSSWCVGSLSCCVSAFK